MSCKIEGESEAKARDGVQEREDEHIRQRSCLSIPDDRAEMSRRKANNSQREGSDLAAVIAAQCYPLFLTGRVEGDGSRGCKHVESLQLRVGFKLT